MDVGLRPAIWDDTPNLLELNNAAVPAVSRLDLAGIRSFGNLAHQFTVVAVDKVPVGFVITLPGPAEPYASPNYGWFSARHDNFLYVDRIVIDPAHWGRGLGRRLYDDVITSGHGLFPLLCAEVNIDPPNERSLDFHEGFGFRRVGERGGAGSAGPQVAMLTRPL